ncbi:hypothetical protein GCM10027180_28450 [Microbulbifer echini]
MLLAAIGFGFYQLLDSYPQILHFLAVAGCAYVIYMGYKIASAPTDKIDVAERSLPRFYEGFLLQWLNPKAWVACVSGVALFSSPHNQSSLLYFVLIYFFVCYLSLALWAFAGDKIRLFLNGEFSLKVFNLAMGLLLILCAAYLMYSHVLGA